jgi:sugar phosphate isomerase/epimerase
MRWTDEAPPTDELLDEMVGVLRELAPAYRDLGVTLAIETHFEFTTFELLRVFDRCGEPPGGPLGICLDTMNLLTMLEDPVLGTERVLPWVVATHLKDGAMLLTGDGLASFSAEPGRGVIDLPRILSLLSRLPRVPNLSLEDHGGRFELPIYDPGFIAGFPDLTADELARLVRLVHRNESRPREERADPLDREDWPAICEDRVARGLATLQRLAREVEDGAS